MHFKTTTTSTTAPSLQTTNMTIDNNNVPSIEITAIRGANHENSRGVHVIVSQTHISRSFALDGKITTGSGTEPVTIELSPPTTLLEKMLFITPDCSESSLSESVILFDGQRATFQSSLTSDTLCDNIPDLVQVVPYDYNELDVTFFLGADGAVYAKGDGKSLFFDHPYTSKRPVERICKNLPPIKQIASNGASSLYMLSHDHRVFTRIGLETDEAEDLLEQCENMTQDQVFARYGLSPTMDITRFACPEEERVEAIFSTRHLLIATSSSGYTYLVPVQVRDMEYIYGDTCTNGGDDDSSSDEDEDDKILEEILENNVRLAIPPHNEDELMMDVEPTPRGNHAHNCTCTYRVDDNFATPFKPIKGRVTKLHEYENEGYAVALLDDGTEKSSLLMINTDRNEPIIKVIHLDRKYASVIVYNTHAKGIEILAITDNLEIFNVSIAESDSHEPTLHGVKPVARIELPALVKSARK